MSLTSGFFDSKLVDGAYDRAYYAAQFAEYFSTFIKNGVFPDPATTLQVSANNPNDMTVLVSPGFGWINGYYCKNDDDYPLIIGVADGARPRIDAIVLRWDRISREITLAVKPGSTSVTPQIPSLDRSADVYELMLASIYISAGVTSISQKDITDTRPNNELCGWVSGTVEQIDTTNLFAQYDNAFNQWFEALKAQLAGDVATNLQNQILELESNKLSIEDKATSAQAEEGLEDSKWMTPLKVKTWWKHLVSSGGVERIEFGEYIGTGEANVRINLGFNPKIVVFGSKDDTVGEYLYLLIPSLFNGTYSEGNIKNYYALAGSVITSSFGTAGPFGNWGCNRLNVNYTWMAIG